MNSETQIQKREVFVAPDGTDFGTEEEAKQYMELQHQLSVIDVYLEGLDYHSQYKAALRKNLLKWEEFRLTNT